MMAAGVKITAVSYLNTIPFIYGLKHASVFGSDILLCPPAQCADNYSSRLADVALLPAAVVPQLKDARIITDYCIGAVQAVRTVELMSDCAIKNIRRIFLDPHSRTSIQLLRWLAAKVWRISPEWCPLEGGYDNLQQRAREGDAFLLIGDKVFEREHLFTYKTDLAEAWQQATGLPFCFAVWVARNGTPYSVIDELQHAFTFGVEHIYESVLEFGFGDKPYNAYEYLTRNIDFLLDENKRKALKKFWSSGTDIETRTNIERGGER
ncbi:MAG: menaquinone biosynthesis protein [Alistipes sp.]|nr:menaquinone biosynthesis protein [Alistipes sp.]